MKKLKALLLIVAISGVVAQGQETGVQSLLGKGSWSASGGYGYKENVLSSEFAPVDSGYSFLSVEGVAKRDLVSSGAEWTNMLLLDRSDYSKVPDLSAEAFGFLLSEYSRHLLIDGKLSAGVQYIYLNQAFDASFDILDEQTIAQKAREPEIHLEWESLVWEFGYSAKIGISDMSFKNLNNDYSAFNWELEIDYELNKQARLVASLDGFDRDYDDRLGRNANGFNLAGTTLTTSQTGFEAGLVLEPEFFGLDNNLEFGIDLEERRDGQFGYYDRDRLKYGVEWEIEAEKWRLQAEVSYSESDYLLQLGTDDRLRAADEWIWQLEAERKLNDSWTLFLQAERDRSASNATFFSYRTNSVLLGIRYR